ncbi:hypothetical protein NU08_2936 [Flavobacterium anhuiense]|uniref:Leucine-rich repeat domain-containing protein n=1 Tax=Flavobacterium anhuiense TaxID=459526 RepID=A0A444VWV9_9FLAO|nr:leucine-rich repeat domain-containing protein [Flavobacterium anhuiense]RYJ38033.1 hypothetical protein NU08_2936 [Flavobacterium anhuiense]
MNIGFNKLNAQVLIEERLKDEDIQQLLNHKRTKVLSLRRLKLDNLEFLLALKELEDLRLYGCTVKDFSALSQLKNLKKLFINAVANDTNNFSFLNELSNLEELGIGYATQFESFPKLTDCLKLKKVSIFNCKKLEAINNVETIPNLETFSIVETPQKPKDLEFVMMLPKIKYFSGAFGGKKNDEEFRALLLKHNVQYG